MSGLPPNQSGIESETRGPRCLCGHYVSEHEGARCHGAYATLMADADDLESVEVLCHCQGFYYPGTDHTWEVR